MKSNNYERIKNMSFEEMKEFIYWIYLNGVLDGEDGCFDSPAGYFGGAMMRDSIALPEDIGSMWDMYERDRQSRQGKKNVEKE